MQAKIGSCPECEISPFTRNHYFTGKLLVERDFRQEQTYYVDKMRLHEQRLHGWGVVCGLKVTQHESPACRSRFVCIEPGLALDCCGHDIYLPEEDCVDLTQLDAIKALIKKNDTDSHTLQICIRYKECPTEPIPVLYDDCGCDDAQCAPNRILESYEIDVMVDPPPSAASPDAPVLSWKNTLSIAHASSVAYHDSTHRLYVLTGDSPGTIYQISTDNFSVLSSHVLGQRGLALAVSNDGSRVYCVASGASAADPQQLYVLDATQAGLPQVQSQPIDIQNSNPGTPIMAVLPAPDNRLLALVGPQGELLRWETDIDTQATPAAATSLVQLGAGQTSFVLGSDGSKSYSGGTGNQLQIFEFSSSSTTAVNILPAGANVTAMGVMQSSAGDLLAICDNGASKLYLVNPASPALIGTLAPQHPPVSLVISPDSRQAYVVEQDAGTSYVEAVDPASLQSGTSVPPVSPVAVGSDSQPPAISASGQTLYIPYTGDPQNPADGGVAIVDIESSSECCSRIWKSLDGCPGCDVANCVVLATIRNFVVGDTFEDQTDPPADPAADTTNKITRIDNRTGRRLVWSTAALAEAIQCLCAEGGGKGAKGDPGLPGKDGTNGQDGTNGTNGTNGTDGQGLEQGLTTISALSWNHNGVVGKLVNVVRLNQSASKVPGVVIAFSNSVQVSGSPVGTNAIDPQHVFQVLIEDDPARNKELGMFCHCPVVGTVVPVDVTLDPNGVIVAAQELAPGDAKAVAFLFTNRTGLDRLRQSQDIWVKLHCDFVIDSKGKAVDGAFLRMQLPTGDHMGTVGTPPTPPIFGMQGGLFESWFRLKG